MKKRKGEEMCASRKRQADLRGFIPDWAKKHYQEGVDDVYEIEGLSPSLAEGLMIGYPNIDPTGTENESPTAKEMIDITRKYDGHLIGYVVTTSREDARISLTGFEINTDKETAMKLKRELMKRELGPDSFRRVGGKKKPAWRFWWD